MGKKKDAHVLTLVATHENGDEWFWCIRCGVLKIEESYFVPGAKQRKILKSAITTPRCVMRPPWPSL